MIPSPDDFSDTLTLGVVAHGAGDLRVESVTLPKQASDQAVVEIAYGGICGSDLHYWQDGASGDSIIRAPMVLGHEVVGTVVRRAPDGSGPAEGTAVAVHPASREESPVRFPADRPNLSAGARYLGSASRFPHTEGAFTKYAMLDSAMLRPLPATLGLRTAALTEPASVAWHALSLAGDARGKRVLVVGSGPIGSLAVAILARAGAAEIIAVDVFEKPLEIAKAMGATRTILAEETEEIAGVDADIVLESSGNHRGLASAMAGATRGGRVVMVGMLPTGEQPVPISLAITKELELFGSLRFNDEIDDVIEALADGSLVVDPIVTHEFPLERSLEAFQVAADPSVSGKVLLTF